MNADHETLKEDAGFRWFTQIRNLEYQHKFALIRVFDYSLISV
jgi:hypothetical protein